MFIAIVLALIISIVNGYVFWWLSVSILFLLSVYFYSSRLFFNSLSITVFLFVVVLMLNMIFVRPVNDPDASYLIGFFASGFLLFSFANEQFVKNTTYILSGLFLLLALWGLMQYLTGFAYLVDVGSRANALFYTPNTYAACLNIILLPLAVMYIHNKGTGKLLPLTLLLFAAILVSQSRGAWVALITGISFIFIVIRILQTSFERKKIVRLTLGFFLVFSVYSVVELVNPNKIQTDFDLDFKNEVGHLVRSDSIVSTLSHRFMLYDIAWQQIKEKPLLGQGFHTYQYFQVRDQRAPHIGNATRFAHNDYLQLWMETGIFGLLLFISVPVIIIGTLFLLRQQLSVEDQVVMFALTTGLVGFYVQALVDFLFYTPFLLMMYGCYLGYLNQLFNKYSSGLLSYKFVLPNIGIRPVIVKYLTGLILVCYLSQPAIAQLTFDQANRYKNRLDIKPALTAYELARRFAPYQPSYYLIEGDIWYHAAKATGEIEPAQRADRLFKQGASANPYRVANLFWRAILHRDMPELLSNPVSVETVLSWLQTVLHWLPNDKQAQAEYVRTLIVMGKYEEARKTFDVYLAQNPESYYLIQVQSEIETYSE